MSSVSKILLPGSDKQLSFLRKNLSMQIEKALVIGSGSEEIAKQLAKQYSSNVDLIVEDYESLMNSKIALGGDEKAKPRLMNFEVTDFDSSYFDLVYAQGSISLTNRNKIIKEIKRILKPNGLLCVGEIVSLKKEVPSFIRNIFNSSNLLPLFIDDLEIYYQERNFKVVSKKNFSETLTGYYLQNAELLKGTKGTLTDQEKSYYKKLLNKISHESNAYLKLGGDKYIGFIALLLEKGGV